MPEPIGGVHGLGEEERVASPAGAGDLHRVPVFRCFAEQRLDLVAEAMERPERARARADAAGRVRKDVKGNPARVEPGADATDDHSTSWIVATSHRPVP